LKVRIETLALTTLVIPEGRLDFGAAAGFQQKVEEALAGSGTTPAAVIIDCTALDYVSSAGLRVFLLAARASQRAGIPFALCALQPAVREVFELSGFSRIITVHANRPTALAQAPQGPACTERRLAVPSDAAHLPALTLFLQEFWSAASLPPAQAQAFELALEEVFMNVVMHGSPAGTAPCVEVSLMLTDAGLIMTVEDDGPEFNPLSLPPPDVTASLGERPIGGHGVFLVRQVMDAVSYQRVGARNRLTMTQRINRRANPGNRCKDR
jgi:serine/threonine-protein kinase RsbW